MYYLRDEQGLEVGVHTEGLKRGQFMYGRKNVDKMLRVEFATQDAALAFIGVMKRNNMPTQKLQVVQS